MRTPVGATWRSRAVFLSQQTMSALIDCSVAPTWLRAFVLTFSINQSTYPPPIYVLVGFTDEWFISLSFIYFRFQNGYISSAYYCDRIYLQIYHLTSLVSQEVENANALNIRSGTLYIPSCRYHLSQIQSLSSMRSWPFQYLCDHLW